MNRILLFFAIVSLTCGVMNIVTFAQQYPMSRTSITVLQNNKVIRSGINPALTNVYAHTEPASASNPINVNNTIVGFNSSYPQTNPTVYTIGAKYSSDGGFSWNVIEALPNANNKGAASDPGMAFSSTGVAYISYVAYGSGLDEVRYNSSSNNGVSWANPTTVYTMPIGYTIDRPNIQADNDPTSPYKDRLYFAWSVGLSTGNLTNGIQFISPSLSGMQQISNDVGWGVDMAIDLNHNLYAVWCDFSGNIRMNKSLNGGQTWNGTTTVKSGIINPVSIGGLRARYYPSIEIDKSPAHPNRIYITYHSGPSSDIDVFSIYSDNGGSNWSNPVQVNNDKTQGTSNGKSQWFPWLTLTNSGIIHVVFYDNRNDANVTTVQTYVATSFDGGLTYTNTSISGSVSLSGIPGLGNGSDYVGDYLAITITKDQMAVSAWMAPSVNEAYDIFTSPPNTVIFSNNVGSTNAGGTLSVFGSILNSGSQKQILASSVVYEKTLGSGPSAPDRFSNFQGGPTVKHNNWNNSRSDYLLNSTFLLPNGPLISQTQTAFYFSLYPAIIALSSIEYPDISGLNLQISDPWYLNSNGSQGITLASYVAPLSQSNGLQGAYNQTVGGIFLNQSGPNYNWDSPCYAVGFSSNQNINIGGINHLISFLNWTTSPSGSVSFQNSNSSVTALVFNSSGATVNANIKGSLLSSVSSEFSINSQRKITRTSAGNLFLTYESMGHIWYEMSTDNGSTWILGNGGKPLDANGGKLPSIDSHGNDFGIVWQENDGGSTKIQIACGSGSSLYNGYPKNVFGDITQSYSNDLNPTIAYDYNGRAIAVWENKTNYVYQAGIIARFGPLSQLSFLGSPTWDGWNTQVIPGTNSSSVTPTIAANKNPTDIYNIKYNIAWTQGSSIQYSGIVVNSSNVMNISSAQTISTGGLPYNKMPSVVTVVDGTARFAWIGQYYPGSNSVVVFRSSNNSTFWYFGSNIRTPQVSIADDNSGYYIIWNEVSDNSTKFTDSQTLSTIYNLNTTGQAVQLSNGTNKNSMRALVYNNLSQPYYFKVSPTIGSKYGLQKSTVAENLNIGRGGVILKDNAGYYFILKDINVEKNRVDFVEFSDTLSIDGVTELNKHLVSQPFTLKDNSTINYKINYGVTDTSAQKSLKGTDYVKFGLELIDASNNKTLGNLEGFEFNSKQSSNYEEKPFKISHSTVGNNKEVYLRIITSTNLNGKCILTKSYSDLSVDLPKEPVIEANFNEIGAITEYSLDQNYPNPFNPTTTISYTIPKNSYVQLKVYDVVGREIAVLVDEIKEPGNYQLTFEASKLTSGIYFYTIKAGDFISSKKLIVLK